MKERDLWAGWYTLDDMNRPVPVTTTKQQTEFRKDFDRRVVGKTTVTPEIKVSTVFLGLDHALPGETPQLFETMVFGGGEDIDQETWRYATWTEAEQGHAAAIDWIKNALAENVRLSDPD